MKTNTLTVAVFAFIASGVDVKVRVNDTTTPSVTDTRLGRFNQTAPDPVIKTNPPAVTLIPTPSLPVVP